MAATARTRTIGSNPTSLPTPYEKLWMVILLNDQAQPHRDPIRSCEVNAKESGRQKQRCVGPKVGPSFMAKAERKLKRKNCNRADRGSLGAVTALEIRCLDGRPRRHPAEGRTRKESQAPTFADDFEENRKRSETLFKEMCEALGSRCKHIGMGLWLSY